jgi:hypothetical protein
MFLMSDLENEPDDSQMLVHLLVYANEVDIEGLVAVTSRWLQNEVHPESIEERVRAYGEVRPSLQRHAAGWPEADDLLAKIGEGPVSEDGWGMDAVGEGQSSSGSELFLKVLRNDDPRPLHVCITAGANCLAQALWDLQNRVPAADFDALVRKIRVYDDSGQDNAGAWMTQRFPHLFYVRGRFQPFALFGGRSGDPVLSVDGPYTWEPYEYSEEGQDAWAEEHIRTGHGPLGALYPVRKSGDRYWSLEGGNTSTWIGLVNHGLYDPGHITWGGWGGRFLGEKQINVPAGQRDVPETEEPYKPYWMYTEAAETWTDGEKIWEDSIFVPIWRWRRAYTNELRARMDWCVAGPDDANHNPVAAVNGDTSRTILRMAATPGETLAFDASASYDPDGCALTFSWYIYPEAGTCNGEVHIAGQNEPKVSVIVPEDAAGSQIHLILEVTDQHDEVPLTAYRRVVIDIN